MYAMVAHRAMVGESLTSLGRYSLYSPTSWWVKLAFGLASGKSSRSPRMCRVAESGKEPGMPASRGLGAPEDWLALLGEGFQSFEVVAAVVGLAAQALDPFVYLRRDGLVVGQDAELFLDDRYGQW
jgi:hypothetical protein